MTIMDAIGKANVAIAHEYEQHQMHSSIITKGLVADHVLGGIPAIELPMQSKNSVLYGSKAFRWVLSMFCFLAEHLLLMESKFILKFLAPFNQILKIIFELFVKS